MVNSELNRSYQEATIKTANDLITVATTAQLQQLSQLSLPEIEEISKKIANVIPAGNVPALILDGLARLGNRRLDRAESSNHIDLLFRGLRQSLDKAVYATFFAAPATVIYGYQQLLRLAGKSPDEAFADGTWQFYLEFALREDSARHANETTGFQDALKRLKAPLREEDQLAAWMLATLKTIHEIPDILTQEWREYVLLNILADVAAAHNIRNHEAYRGLRRQWEKQLPYKREGAEPYPRLRQQQFDAFWKPQYDGLTNAAQSAFDAAYTRATEERLSAFLKQMTWLAYADPGRHREVRVPYGLAQANIGVIYQERYYLVPLAELRHSMDVVRRVAATIIKDKPSGNRSTLDVTLVTARRSQQTTLREHLGKTATADLEMLRQTPVFINWDIHDAAQPLAIIRNGARRGIGDHPLTLIRTEDSIVFDQSHIFFDGAWGAAIAQIMTHEATAIARQLSKEAAVKPNKTAPYSPTLRTPGAISKAADRVRIAPEASAEHTGIDLAMIQETRQALKQRSIEAHLTVNDILLLYRVVHGQLYQPSNRIIEQVNQLRQSNDDGAKQAYQAINTMMERTLKGNPAILIPIDARRFDPRERVFPTTFSNPFADLYGYHKRTLAALHANEQAQDSGRGERREVQRAFQEEQRTYLGVLAGFGEVLLRYKEIAMQGNSASTTTIKFLAHMPDALRTMLNEIPGRFDALNELIKGDEVFSNIGRVASGSSLRRFISAKDDNEQKKLVWGIQTTDKAIVHISLRDFRPHVRVLNTAGYEALAQLIAQDYLNAYVEGLNRYVHELHDIASTSPKARSGLFQLFR